MSNKQNRSSNLGYYIALGLCAAAIGVFGYLYTLGSEDVDPQLNDPDQTVAGTVDQDDVPVVATKPQSTHPTAGTTEPSQSTEPTDKGPLKTGYPVEGQTVAVYAMDALSYNQTTRDWRVHNGIDLAAETGAQVVAAADGEIYTVFEDDAYGHTVVIRHDDGYTTCYASLSDDVAVRPGDTVTMGQTIGYAADSAIVESSIGSHVHFSVTFYDEPMDPMEFLALGQ